MLGDVLGELTGKRIVRRVLSVDPTKVEISFEESGQMLGVATNSFGTYTSMIRPDGSLYGEGVGVMVSREGDMVSWVGSGQGKFTPGGGVSYRGILYFQTTSQKLARLNAAPGVFEYEVDGEGKSHTKTWEWK